LQQCRIFMKSRDILINNNLSVTRSRLNILDLFLYNTGAFSEKDLQLKLKGICDRATIYRTLKRYKDFGIIHPIATEGMITKYVLKKEPEEHLHFKCNDCGEIVCLPEVQIKNYQLPPGYMKKESNFLVVGTCNICNS